MKMLWGNEETPLSTYKVEWWVAIIVGAAIEYANIIAKDSIPACITISLFLWGFISIIPKKIMGGIKEMIVQHIDMFIITAWGVISINKENDPNWILCIALTIKIIIEGNWKKTKIFEDLHFFKLTAITIVIACWVNSISGCGVTFLEQASFIKMLILTMLFKRKEDISTFIMGLAGYGILRFYGTQAGGATIKGGVRNYNALTNAGILALVLVFGGKKKTIPSIILGITLLTSHSVGAGMTTGLILISLWIINELIGIISKKMSVIILAIGILLGVALWYNIDTVFELLHRSKTLDSRTDYWRTAISMLKYNHFYPYGGNFWQEWGSIASCNLGANSAQHGHNAFIDGLVKWGWGYLLLLISSILICIYQTNTNKVEKCILLIGIALPICVQAPTGMIWIWGVVCCCATWWGLTGKYPSQKYYNA
jgi:hypothetical protein